MYVELADAYGNHVDAMPDASLFEVTVEGPDGPVKVAPTPSVHASHSQSGCPVLATLILEEISLHIVEAHLDTHLLC